MIDKGLLSQMQKLDPEWRESEKPESGAITRRHMTHDAFVQDDVSSLQRDLMGLPANHSPAGFEALQASVFSMEDVQTWQTIKRARRSVDAKRDALTDFSNRSNVMAVVENYHELLEDVYVYWSDAQLRANYQDWNLHGYRSEVYALWVNSLNLIEAYEQATGKKDIRKDTVNPLWRDTSFTDLANEPGFYSDLVRSFRDQRA